MQLRGRDGDPCGHDLAFADRILGGLRATQSAAGATGEVATPLQQLREALPRDADLHISGSLARYDLDAANLIRARHQPLTEREADGVILEVGRGREHHHVWHVVIDERHGRLFRDEVSGIRERPARPALNGDFRTHPGGDLPLGLRLCAHGLGRERHRQEHNQKRDL